jgi:hypothetical protein
MEDVDRTRRHILREGLCSCMNDTKWQELVEAVRSQLDFTPRYRQKHVRADEPTDWDREWFYHLRPYSVVDWVDIDPFDRSSDSPADRTASIEEMLRRIQIPFSRENGIIRVWGFVRPGSSPQRA